MLQTTIYEPIKKDVPFTPMLLPIDLAESACVLHAVGILAAYDTIVVVLHHNGKITVRTFNEILQLSRIQRLASSAFIVFLHQIRRQQLLEKFIGKAGFAVARHTMKFQETSIVDGCLHVLQQTLGTK